MAVKSAARLVPGVDQAITQGTKTVVEPLAKNVLAPLIKRIPGIGIKSSDEIMEGVAKNSPIMFGRTDESIIGGIKNALDNELVNEKQVVKMFKEDQLVNINVTGRRGMEAAENAKNKANLNNVIDQKTPNDTVDPIITVSEELQSPKLKTINKAQVIEHYDKTLRDIEELYQKKPGITEATDAKSSLDATVNISGSSKNQDFYSKRKKLENLALREKEVPGGETNYKEMHHELMKAVFAPFIRRARQLGSKMDVINLGLIADEFGFGLGDQFSAIRQLDRVPHLEAHKFLLAAGIQPDEIFGVGSAISREKIDIRGIQTIDELTARFKERIQDLAVPMREEMEIFQDAWNLIPSSDRLKLWTLKLNKKKLSKLAKENPTKTNQLAKTRAEKAYKKFKEKLVKELNEQVNFRKAQAEAATEAASDKTLRKQMDAASPEDWTPKSNQPAQGPVTGGNPELTKFTQNLRKHGGLKEKN